MSQKRKYQPSNGTEGMSFIDFWCGQCERDRSYRDDAGDSCEILGKTFLYKPQDDEYPSEWCYGDDGIPKCTAFVPEGERIPEADTQTEDMFA